VAYRHHGRRLSRGHADFPSDQNAMRSMPGSVAQFELNPNPKPIGDFFNPSLVTD
jgi:hypothetical protein